MAGATTTTTRRARAPVTKTRRTAAARRAAAKKSAPAAPAAAATPAPAAAPAPAPSEAAPAPASAPAVEESSSSDPFWDRMASLEELVRTLTKELRSLRSEARARERRMAREERAAERLRNKPVKKTKKKSGPPTGFAKPGPISRELANFLGESPDTEVARTDVTKRISNYIKEHNLQIESNRRCFQPDAALTAILGPAQYPIVKAKEATDTRPAQEEGPKGYSYFNLQKYLNPHFPKRQ